ncbi:MAG: 4Fe-4S binding protein [Xanthobacteraceae bacterium]
MLVLSVVAITIAMSQSAAADLGVAKGFFAPDLGAAVREADGSPPSAVVRARDGRVLGYAFSTREVSGSVGYSGRPLDIVAAVTPEGIIAGATIAAHEEPILVIGIPREALAAYVANFRGFDVNASAAAPATGGSAGPRVVAGASVTSTVIRDAILRSARAVLRVRSAQAAPSEKPRLDRETLRRLSWPVLVAEGAVRQLLLARGEAARLTGVPDNEPDKIFIELWLALATPPAIGESLVDQRVFERELARLGPDDNLVLIAASGLYSFMGTEWRRSGVFDRIEIVQGTTTIRFAADDYTRVNALRAPGAPELREIGLFRIANSTGFDPTEPFRLDLTLARDRPGPEPPPIVSLEYRVPERYLIGSADQTTATGQTAPRLSPAAGSAEARALELAPMQAPLWQDIWWTRRFEIALLCVMLAALGAILVFQKAVASRVKFYHRLRTVYLAITFVFIGLIANAQLSIVNVVTFTHAFLSGFRWELFLLDPMVFILWGFVAVSMLFWGRGVFCGWLCPFGAIQELLNMLPRAVSACPVQHSLRAARTAVDGQIRDLPRYPRRFAQLDHGGLRPCRNRAVQDRDHAEIHARLAVCRLCRGAARRRIGYRTLFLPLSLSARRGDRHPGAVTHVRMAAALSGMRVRMPSLCPPLHRAGDSSARADQSQRMHPLPGMPGDLLR